MKYIRVLMVMLLTYLIQMHVHGQVQFTIEGKGEHIQNGDSIFLSYKDKGQYVLKSTIAQNKRFTFTGDISRPLKASIGRNENPLYVDIITDNVDIYLEPRTITIHCPSSLTEAFIGGSPLNDTLQVLRNQLTPLLIQKRNIKDPYYYSEVEKRDTAFVNANQRALLAVEFDIINKELAFAQQHPHSLISLDILQMRVKNNNYINNIEPIYAILASTLKETTQGKAIAATIEMERRVRVGMQAPDFTLLDTAGIATSLSTLKGKYVLLDFWADWCSPCREEHPHLRALYTKHKKHDFTILSIFVSTDKQKWVNAIQEDQLTWPQASDLQGNKGNTHNAYGITTIPANFLVDPNGTVVAKDLKGEALSIFLDQLFLSK